MTALLIVDLLLLNPKSKEMYSPPIPCLKHITKIVDGFKQRIINTIQFIVVQTNSAAQQRSDAEAGRRKSHCIVIRDAISSDGEYETYRYNHTGHIRHTRSGKAECIYCANSCSTQGVSLILLIDTVYHVKRIVPTPNTLDNSIFLG